jgi:hypothetical protein
MEKTITLLTSDDCFYCQDLKDKLIKLNISFDEIENFVYVNNITGTLNTNQALKGLKSGAIRVATDTTNPSLHLYSGKVLYISDKLPVTRDVDQTDRIKFIISF